MGDHDHAAQIAAYGRCVACTAAAITPEAPTPREARDDALGRVEAGTPLSWTVRARQVIRDLAAEGEPFTSDEVWARIDQPPEPRALGAALLAAQDAGVIRPTGLTVASKRPECHMRPVRVWVSATRHPQGPVGTVDGTLL